MRTAAAILVAAMLAADISAARPLRSEPDLHRQQAVCTVHALAAPLLSRPILAEFLWIIPKKLVEVDPLAEKLFVMRATAHDAANELTGAMASAENLDYSAQDKLFALSDRIDRSLLKWEGAYDRHDGTMASRRILQRLSVWTDLIAERLRTLSMMYIDSSSWPAGMPPEIHFKAERLRYLLPSLNPRKTIPELNRWLEGHFGYLGATMVRSGEPVVAFVDPGMLWRIVRNLIRNARDAGAKQITLTYGYADESHRELEFSVTDNGHGFSPAQRQNWIDVLTGAQKSFTTRSEASGKRGWGTRILRYFLPPGARVKLEPLEPGTRITLRLPLTAT